MSDIAIRVEGLGKQYRIGGPRSRYKTIRESIMDGVKAPFQRATRVLRGQAYGAAGLDQTIWALKDVSFDVKQGEVLGIIGRNGAGKSTLLKVLSRITEPTEGEVMLRGRVGSLLEVGTGFHPELTGRENVYLNGTILGMKRAEIERNFDEIVDFSGISKFIDTPVKHYSSGMYVRLAFSVAAHLETEILVVDEVLAVGDAAFQKKCLGKMSEVGRSGRTILFVSHNMDAVETLTAQTILLHEGSMTEFGPTRDVIGHYLDFTAGEMRRLNEDLAPARRLIDGSEPLLQAMRVTSSGQPTRVIASGESIEFEFDYSARVPLRGMRIGIGVNSASGHRVLSVNSEYDRHEKFDLDEAGTIRCTLGALPLNTGDYQLEVNVEGSSHSVYERFLDVGHFTIVPKGSENQDLYARTQRGYLAWAANWEVNKTDSQ